jgi:hypothetical protein
VNGGYDLDVVYHLVNQRQATLPYADLGRGQGALATTLFALHGNHKKERWESMGNLAPSG